MFTIGVCCLVSGYSQSGATVYVGPTFMNFDVEDDNLSPFNIGYRAGIDARIGDKSFWMLFGLSYSDIKIDHSLSNLSISGDSGEALTFISGKFNLEQRLFVDKKFRPTIGGGVIADHIIQASDYFKDQHGNLSTLSLYWNVALGLQYKAVFVRCSYEKMVHKYFYEQENPRPYRLVVTTGFFF